MHAQARRALVAMVIQGSLVAALFLAGCARPGEDKCKQVCLHYSKLFLDQKYADKAKGLAPEELAKLEADKAAEWQDVQQNPHRGLYACVTACDRVGRGGTAECILEAKTFEEAKKCDPE